MVCITGVCIQDNTMPAWPTIILSWISSTRCVRPSITALGKFSAFIDPCPVSSNESNLRTSFGSSRAKKMTSQSIPAASPLLGNFIWCVIGGAYLTLPQICSGISSSQVFKVVVLSIGCVFRTIANLEYLIPSLGEGFC